MSLDVYTSEYVGKPSNHKVAFIEIRPREPESEEHGRIYHVTGSLIWGMSYETRTSRDPALSQYHIEGSKKRIGTILKENLVRFDFECCRAVPPPDVQIDREGEPLDPNTPIYHCGHWLKDVIDLAFQKGIIRPWKEDEMLYTGELLF